MDFIDQLRQFSKRVDALKDRVTTEEATKTSIIMPFFQLLGYDVFNPHEFLPEFTADVGIKKGEKVDYAIIMNSVPVILIEAKWCGETLDKHDSQLFRYFGTTSAKFAILTNGIVYKFFTDLDENNKMDCKPFLEFNILDIKEAYVNELKKFHKDSFDVETIFNTAAELKYSSEIMKFMSQQLKTPSDEFIKYILGEVYSGVRTQNVIDKFRDIVRKSLNQFVNELMSDKITNALKTSETATSESDSQEDDSKGKDEEPVSKIKTTEDELEAFFIVRQILSGTLPKDKITYKDTQSYFGILYEDNRLKWICRVKINGQKIVLYLPDEDKKPIKCDIETLEGIYHFKKDIIDIANKYVSTAS